ncbi:Alpha/Beta hydrolase protein [Penicillium herquei]|nr:Alpha/Beta hydrolase protein [Penicillium herquei]
MERLKSILNKPRSKSSTRSSKTLNSQPSQASPSQSDPEPSGPPLPFPDGVKVLHECEEATVDICFIHGLTGNRESTWTAEGQSVPWPKLLLPSVLKTARIITYGYDAYVVRGSVAGSERLIDHATNLLNDLANDRACDNASSRALIFVCHSLGGLVCKKAILSSCNNPEPHLRDIFDCTKGIIFMGTPHKGSWMADWSKISVKALGIVKSTNASLLDNLKTNNQLLEAIQVDFWSMVREQQRNGRSIEIACFFEALPLPVFGVVATLEGYSSFSIHANHSQMVKFSSADDNGYKRVQGELRRWEQNARYLLTSSA